MDTLNRRDFLRLAIGVALGVVPLWSAGCGCSATARRDDPSPIGAGGIEKTPIPGPSETASEEYGGETQESGDVPGADEAAGAADAPYEGPVSTVVCMGDSLTFGEGTPDPATQSWPAVLSRLLGEGFQVLNFGVNGATVIHASDVPYRATGFVEQAVGLQPSVAFMMFGTNDSRVAWWDPEAFRLGLIDMIEDLRAGSPNTRIVLLAPPRPYEAEFADFYDGVDPDPNIRDQVRPIIRATSAEMGLGFIDLYAFTTERPEWYSDGIHLNVEGYEAVADEIYRIVW